MNPADDRIRDVLGKLRQAPVPPVPGIRPAPPGPRRAPVAPMAVAAAMLAALTGMLFLRPSRSLAPEAAVGSRLEAVEAKLALVEHAELRALVTREIELLHRELELSRGSP